MKRLFSVAKYLFFLAIGVFLLWLAFKNQDKSKILEGFRNARYDWILLSVVFMLLAHISRSIRWTMLINPLGFRISKIHSFVAVMIGYLANIALPRMGEISRCIVLNRTDKIPVNKLIGTVVVERVLDFISLLSIVLLTFIIEFDRLKNFYFTTVHPGIVKNFQQFLNVKTFLILGILLITGFLGLRYINRKHRENPIIAKLRHLLKGFVSGIRTVRSMENNWLFLFHTVFIWFMYWAMTYVVFFSLNETSHLGVVAGLTSFSIGSLGFIMPVQAGIGTFHWAVKEGLKLYHINPADGLLYATLMHGSQTLVVIIIGGLCFLWLFLLQQKHRKNERISQN